MSGRIIYLLGFLTLLPLTASAQEVSYPPASPLSVLPLTLPPNMSVPAETEEPPIGCAKENASLQEAPKAEEETKKEILSGSAVIQECNLMIVGGQIVSLWGIAALAPDQQCWQDDAAWGCGQQATLFLRHFIGGWPISCEVRERPENAPALVTCYRQREETREDIAAALVRLGWALANAKAQGVPYAEEEAKAKAEKRGVWGSRFQTAEDWEEGVQRFMGETEEK